MERKKNKKHLAYILFALFVLTFIFTKKDICPITPVIQPDPEVYHDILQPPEQTPSSASLSDGFFEDLIALHEHKRPPGPNDWLAQHPEPGQPYADYIKQNHVKPEAERNTIYITLLGDFDAPRKQIVEQTARYIETYYQMPVKMMPPIPLSEIPDHARRVHPIWKDKQVRSTYVIDQVLAARKPEDAYCLIAFTSSDLWPGGNWNFVFGQASMEDRVGVWSIYRNGDPAKSEQDRKLCLRRTIKTGTHEIGHMFGLYHCIYFECNMNGSNHRKESDEAPIWLCPVCLKKLHWLHPFDIQERYQQLLSLSQEFDMAPEVEFYQRSLDFIQQYKEASEVKESYE